MDPMLFIASLAGLGIFIVALTHAALMARQSFRNAAKKTKAAQPDKSSAIKEKPEGLSADFAELIDTITQEGQATRAEEKREDDMKQTREWLTIALLIATVVLLGWQVSEMVKVYGPIERQADAAQRTLIATQRAWMRITDMHISVTGLRFNNGGADISFELRTKNLGNTVANNVAFYFLLVPSANIKSDFYPDPWIVQKEWCDAARHQSVGTRVTTVFPNDVYPTGGGTLGTGAHADSKDIIQVLHQGQLDPDTFALSVVGCIDYAFPTNPKGHHQVGVIMTVARKPSADSFDFKRTMGNLPGDQLMLLGNIDGPSD